MASLADFASCPSSVESALPSPVNDACDEVDEAPVLEAEEPLPAVQDKQPRSARFLGKPCAICGHPATGYHYEAPACNSCKTFFRRTVLSGKFYRCQMGDGLCMSRRDNLNNKIKCRSCRYQMCVDKGMRPDAVTSQKEVEVDEPTPLVVQLEVATEDAVVPVALPVVTLPQVPVLSNCANAALSRLAAIENRIDQFRSCRFDSYALEPCFENRLNCPSILGEVDRHQQIVNWFDDANRSPSRRGEPRESPSCRDLPEWLIHDLFTTLEYAKTFPEFNTLGYEDKCEMLHFTVLPLTMATQCYDSYRRGFNMVVLPDGISPVQYLPNVLMNGVLYRSQYDAFIRVVEPFSREAIDRNEYLLLKAVLLFDSTVPKLTPSAEETVSQARCHYMRLLFEHIQRKVGTEKAPARLGALLSTFQLYVHNANIHRNHMVAMEAIRQREDEKIVRETILRFRC